MSEFEEDLSSILMDFRNRKLNFAQTTLKIEELVIHCLGFTKWAESQSNKPVHPTQGGTA